MRGNEEEIKKLLMNQGEVTLVQEFDFLKIHKNYALLGAIKEEDVDAVRVLLNRAADPNFQVDSKLKSRSLFKQFNLEIGKLLVEFGFNLDKASIGHIFANRDGNFVEEIVSWIFKYNPNNKKLVRLIFQELLRTDINLKPLEESEIFKLLLDNGLPVENYGPKGAPSTLHRAIRKFNFVSLLVKRGADVNKRDSEDNTPLIKAVYHGNKSTVRLLLRSGARINDASNGGYTALHKAASLKKPNLEIIHILLEYGADVNAKTDYLHMESYVLRKTPLRLAERDDVKEIFVKEFANMEFSGRKISHSNMGSLTFVFMNENRLENTFIKCLKELEKMSKHEIHDGISLHDVLELRGKHDQLAKLAENEDFMVAFETEWDRKKFKNYAKDLCRIMKMPRLIDYQKKCIYESGLAKHFLVPPEIMEIIVKYASYNIWFKGVHIPKKKTTEKIL